MLVWLSVLLTTSRQVGKSVLVGDLALWRLEQAERWGEPQLALLTSKDNAAAADVHRPSLAWARAQRWKVREANGEQEIAAPDGSRWAIRGSGSVSPTDHAPSSWVSLWPGTRARGRSTRTPG